MFWHLAVINRLCVPKEISQGVIGADPTFLLLLCKHFPLTWVWYLFLVGNQPGENQSLRHWLVMIIGQVLLHAKSLRSLVANYYCLVSQTLLSVVYLQLRMQFLAQILILLDEMVIYLWHRLISWVKCFHLKKKILFQCGGDARIPAKVEAHHSLGAFNSQRNSTTHDLAEVAVADV